ncbi:hypothetical protein EJB05_40487, partial [Eragrostis curvula]
MPELGIGIVAYSPLGRGFLSSGPKVIDSPSEQDFRRTGNILKHINKWEGTKCPESNNASHRRTLRGIGHDDLCSLHSFRETVHSSREGQDPTAETLPNAERSLQLQFLQRGRVEAALRRKSAWDSERRRQRHRGVRTEEWWPGEA